MQTTMQTRSAPAAGRPALSARTARGGRVVVAAGSSYHSNWRTQSTNPANGNGTSLSTYDRKSSSLSGRPSSPLPAQPVRLPGKDNVTDRYQTVLRHFPSALGVDDFIARVEVALCYFGFTGDNSIGEPRQQGRTTVGSIVSAGQGQGEQQQLQQQHRKGSPQRSQRCRMYL
jgi:hypothetical protein